MSAVNAGECKGSDVYCELNIHRTATFLSFIRISVQLFSKLRLHSITFLVRICYYEEVTPFE